MLMQPLMTASPGPVSRGRDSPVRAAVSTVLLPLQDCAVQRDTFPRFDHDDIAHRDLLGIRLAQPSGVSRLAWSGRMSIRAAMEERERPTA